MVVTMYSTINFGRTKKQTNRSFQKKFSVSEIYNEINTPLTVVSVIVSPNPLNVLKLAKMAKEQADEKKARF